LHIVAATGVFTVAWTAGFLTPGAPAGLGVREAILVLGFTPLYGEAAAIGMAGALRIVSVIGDGLSFGIGLLIPHVTGRSTALASMDAPADAEPELAEQY
jgi:uncharacterized membrane protein YbhN (UPF0104 family)